VRPVLEGASAFVAGGASGLGAATATALASAGAKVVVADSDKRRGAAIGRQPGCTFSAGDVTSAADVAAAVEAAVALAPLRACVVCAGVGGGESLLDRNGRVHDLEVFERIVRINLTGTFNVVRLAAAAMSQNDPDEDGQRGVIVATASIAAYDGQAGATAYAASKAGVVGLTLPAARDLSRWGIRIVTIAPGLFDTPLAGTMPERYRARLDEQIAFPSRPGDPADFARLVLAVIENRYVNGETIRIDGGLRPPPG
jgi:NAD(P)-dependent dehydrogenase (short-subunit alcohol dehydrogenase family)